MKALTKTQHLAGPGTPTVRRLTWLLAGHLLFGLGIIGMLLPVLPTTIFWIGAATCYLKGSPEHYQRLANKGRTGKIIAAFIDHGVIGRTEKKIAVAGMTVSAMITLILPMPGTFKLIAIGGILLAMVYILTRSETVSAHV